jgi:hypothetical protein
MDGTRKLTWRRIHGGRHAKAFYVTSFIMILLASMGQVSSIGKGSNQPLSEMRLATQSGSFDEKGLLSEEDFRTYFAVVGNYRSDCPAGYFLVNRRCVLPNILIIGWDGTQRDHFWECYNKALPECPDGLPNIAALTEGKIFNNTTTNAETSTKPGWVQLLTGYNAEVTGTYNLLDYKPIPKGYSLFEKVERKIGPNEIITIFVSAKSIHTGGACIGDPTFNHLGEPIIEDKGQPWCLAKDQMDIFDLDCFTNDSVGNRALDLIEMYQEDQFLAFFLFADPDRTGHLEGENSSGYSKKIVEVDAWLGKILAKLRKVGIDNRTLVYVVTDHGFGEDLIHHLNAPYGFLASNDPLIIRSGDRKDLTPTILEKYGISREAVGKTPAVDGFSLYSYPPLDCIPEGGAYLDYPGAPACCTFLQMIGLDIGYGYSCIPPTGGAGDASGYCSKCGDGVCRAPENKCNCSQDCK